MNIHISKSESKGSIIAPSSKSILHRLLICASLSKNKSIIKNVDLNDDVKATISCLKSLGALIEVTELKDKSKIYIRKSIDFNNEAAYLDASDSASTLRFLLPLCLLLKRKIVFKMGTGLAKRPNTIYDELFKDNIKRVNNELILLGNLRSGYFDVKGDVSSQFISGLMFALPLLKENSRIRIIPPFSSKSYVKMTIKCLKMAGVEIEEVNSLEYYIKGNQKYIGFDKEIEGDYSSISNMLAIGAVSGGVNIHNLSHDSIQGDKKIINYLLAMNANIISTNDGYKISKSILKGVEIDIDDNIDLALILISLCSVINDTSYIRNVGRLKYKETSRLDCLLEELSKMDFYYEVEDNCLKIFGGINTDGGMSVRSHNDHRIFMALCMIGTCLKNGLTINDIECVNKSYPNFLSDLDKIGIKYQIFGE